MSSKTISRNSAARAALILACGGAVLAAGAALAQNASIQVESLRPVDPFSIGILGQSEGGLPNTLWEGTTAELAREAMSRIPTDSRSPAVNRLISGVLLSGGAPPEGGDGELLAVQRIQALTDAGFAAQAAQLSARTPDISNRADLAEAQATGELMAGNLPAACNTANTLDDGRDGAFWLRLRAVCLAVEGETSRADLTAQLARQGADSAQFERAYALALLDDAEDERVETADPLVFAAAVAAGANVTTASAAPRSMIAPTQDKTLAALRAAQAAADGLSPDAAVAAAYMAVEAPEDAPDGASRLDVALDSPNGAREALLYQLALDEEEDDVSQRAQALAASLESERSAKGFLLASRLLLPALRTLPVDAGRDDGLLFANAAAAAGDAALARRWLTAASERPAATPQTDPDSGAPVPLGVAPPWTPPRPADLAASEALAALYAESPEAAASRLDSEGDARVRFIDAVVLDALGKSAEPQLRLALLRGEGGDGARADADVLLAMESAAKAGAMAETALLAAAAMGQGPATLAPADLARVLRALAEAGLEQQAREAGLEAMLAARLG